MGTIASARSKSPSKPKTFMRTSLPMYQNRGGAGDKTEHRDQWKSASHDKVLPPTGRVVRQVGEAGPWRRHDKHDLGRPPVPFNKFSQTLDQDGYLDEEAKLFAQTVAGKEYAAQERARAARVVAARSATEGAGKDLSGEKGAASAWSFGASNGPAAGTMDNQAEVEEEAAKRGLIKAVLQRNGPHLERIALNPGSRKGTKSAKGGPTWKELDKGPAGKDTHFDRRNDPSKNVDIAMAIVDDPAAYAGDYPLYISDLYNAEREARVQNSTQIARVLQPPRPNHGREQGFIPSGGKSALNPPAKRFGGDVYAAATAQLDERRKANVIGRGRPNTAPALGARHAALERSGGALMGTTKSATLRPRGKEQTFGNRGDGGDLFTSAYRLATHFESDHLEQYEGQWAHTKTLAPTARGVRQQGEHAPVAGGVGLPGHSREGRNTVKRHLGPSRPGTTPGLYANTAGNTAGASVSVLEGPQRRPPPGRWSQPDRGRQLPVTLYDHMAKDGVRAPFFEAPVYARDQSDKSVNLQSMSHWGNFANAHEKHCWSRGPNTGLYGAVYTATQPRSLSGGL